MDLESLKGWGIRFIRNRDLIKREISSIDDDGPKITVNLKDKRKIQYLVCLKLTGKDLEFDGTIICVNDRDNVLTLYEHWNKAIKSTGLKIIFCEPDQNKKFIICPNTHDKIADRSSLKMGLLSMHETIKNEQ